MKETIARLRELEKKATKGPWEYAQFEELFRPCRKEYAVHAEDKETIKNKDGSLSNSLVVCRGMDGENGENNSMFIAASRNALPKLLDYIEKLECEVGELKIDVDNLEGEFASLGDDLNERKDQ